MKPRLSETGTGFDPPPSPLRADRPRSRVACLGFLSGTLLLTAAVSAAAQGIVVKATGDFTEPVIGIVTSPIIKITAAVKSDSDKTIPIVFTRDVNGVAADNAQATSGGAPTVYDPNGPPPGTLGLYLTKAKILQAGPPPKALAALSTTPAVANTAVAKGSSSATITAALNLNAKGEVVSAGATTKTSVDTSIPGFAIFKPAASAYATAAAGTDPFVFAPLATSGFLDLHIDLNPNYLSNPQSRFGLEAFSSDPTVGSANYELDYKVTSNLPGLATIFNLDVSADSSSSAAKVLFTSDSAAIGAAPPITAGDFSSPLPGEYILDPNKSQFDVEVPIPAGVFGSNPSAADGLVFNVDESATSSVVTSAAVPEASTTVSFGLPLALGLGGLMVAAKRRKAAASPS